MKLQDFFDEHIVVPLGYRPNSASIKPVHIANGLCRAALGVHYDPVKLNHALNRWVKQQERHSTEDLIEAAKAQLGELAEPQNIGRLNTLRKLLKDVLGADQAVYDKNENCSYTLTHSAHITPDHNDRHTGDFLAHVLNADLGSGPSPVVRLLKKLLDDASDEITVLSLPLTADEECNEYDTDYDEPESLKTRVSGGESAFKQPILRYIRAGFDSLAKFETERGSKLHSLRRLVSFATFSIYLHLIHRALDFEDGRTFKTRRPLMLFDFVQEGWGPIALASHASYNLAAKKIDQMLVSGVRAGLEQEYATWTRKRAEDFIEGVVFKGSEKVQERKQKHFLEVFRSYVASLPILDALATAIVDVMLEDLSGTPSDFARALGVRGGLLAPRGQRAVRKRYSPSPELLEVLLASSMSPDEELKMDELADRWRESYGILTGVLPTDATDLANASILDAQKEHLVDNHRALKDILIKVGFAREYADGVTIVTLAGAKRHA